MHGFWFQLLMGGLSAQWKYLQKLQVSIPLVTLRFKINYNRSWKLLLRVLSNLERLQVSILHSLEMLFLLSLQHLEIWLHKGFCFIKMHKFQLLEPCAHTRIKFTQECNRTHNHQLLKCYQEIQQHCQLQIARDYQNLL